MRPPRLSVILPVRDGAGTVGPALTSILEGSFSDLEVIVVDDGSGDGSGEVVKQIGAQYGRVRLLRQPRLGLVESLNRGLAVARGELIGRQDADDLSTPDRLARQVALLDEDQGLSATGCGIAFEAAGPVSPGLDRYAAWQNALVGHDAIRAACLIESPVTHATLVMRRAALVAVDGWRDRGWPEDHDLVCRFIAAGHRIGKVPDVLYRWRDHERRLTRRDRRYRSAAFHALRLHFLSRLVLDRPRRIDLWGAGALLRRWQADLTARGHEVRAAPVAPRRLKVSQAGRVELDPRRLPRRGGELLLVAFGLPASRDPVRRLLASEGLAEGRDFWCLG